MAVLLGRKSPTNRQKQSDNLNTTITMKGMKRKSGTLPQGGGKINTNKKPKSENSKGARKDEDYEVDDGIEKDTSGSGSDSDSDDEDVPEENSKAVKASSSTVVPSGNSANKKPVDDSDEEEIYDPALAGMKKTGQTDQQQILVILDLASLETVKTKKGDFQLLNCDDHIGLIRKFRKDPNEYRPDIIHQELMAVLDSPLNKAGKVKVLVHTEKNVLFEVSSKTRIPRTFKRFSGLMVQLLHRLKIRSADGRDMLLKVVKNPISRHIPAGAKVIGFSHLGELKSPTAFAKTLPTDGPIVLMFGAQATRGILKENHPYVS